MPSVSPDAPQFPPSPGRPSAGPAGAPPPPPERLDAGPLLLRRVSVQDADAIAAAVGASLDHLRPWMPWATPDAADARNQASRAAEADELWDSGSDYVYSMFTYPGHTLIGQIGLHRRVGDGGVEVGYWIAAAHVGRGYGTAAADAVTAAGLALPGIRRVEIHCDEANTASAAIPRKLGYRLDRIEIREPEAPGETGRLMVWIKDAPGRGPALAGQGAR